MKPGIKQARERLETMRLALLSPSPEDIQAAIPGLEEAVECLAAAEREIRAHNGAPFEVRRELTLLKNELKLTLRLIEQGTAFGNIWAKMLGAGPAYTQAGTSAPPIEGPAGALSIRG